jgi:hypothetical protein
MNNHVNPLILIIMVQTMAHAQEPRTSILESGEIPSGFYKAGIRYGEIREDSLYIRWAHASEADTFWVYRGDLSLEYVTNLNTKAVFYNQPVRYERRMAIHHLREFLFNSPLKFHDIEALAKGQNPLFLKGRLAEHFTR